jgi:type VI secretion system lysozyme-like protein
MARFTPSLLDRLTEDPDLHKDQDLSRWEQRLLEDVELLLNAKRAAVEVPEEFVYTSQSLPMYGLPDCTSLNVKAPSDQKTLRQAIENVLRNFEPRLSSVSVSMDTPSDREPVLRFTVHALARLDPRSEPIRFETKLQIDSSKFEVRKHSA